MEVALREILLVSFRLPLARLGSCDRACRQLCGKHAAAEPGSKTAVLNMSQDSDT